VVNRPADSQQSGPLPEQVERRTGRKVKEHLIDEGYVALNQIDVAERAGVAVYAPLPKGKDGQPVKRYSDSERGWLIQRYPRVFLASAERSQ
jgi:hypothetical protein